MRERFGGRTRKDRRSRVGRNNVEASAIDLACRAGYYDTNFYYHIPGGVDREPLVTFTVERFLPERATNHFSIQVDHTGYLVTRYEDGSWSVEFDDKTETQKRERRLREDVLTAALCYFAERLQVPLNEVLGKLLDDGVHPDLRTANISGHHPIVHDEPLISVPLKDHLFQNIRRWSVTIGSSCCFVGLAKDSPDPEFVILSS